VLALGLASAGPSLTVNVFGGDYEVFEDSRGDGWHALGFLLGAPSRTLGVFGRGYGGSGT
jgi:hypothetical protein